MYLNKKFKIRSGENTLTSMKNVNKEGNINQNKLGRISRKHSRQSRPRCEWHWGEAWSSATTSTTAKCGVGGTFSDSSGQPQGPGVAPEVSCSLYGRCNLWRKPASKTRSCWDARHGAPPSDPGLRHGRTPVLFYFFREQRESGMLKKIVYRKCPSGCTLIIYCDNEIYNNQFVVALMLG